MAKTKRTDRRTREDYERLLQEQEKSGLTLKAFAESKGINPMTFYSWSRRLRGALPTEPEDRKGFVEVELVAEPQHEVPDPTGVGFVFDVTTLGGRVVTVRPGFDAPELARLIDLLESGC